MITFDANTTVGNVVVLVMVGRDTTNPTPQNSASGAWTSLGNAVAGTEGCTIWAQAVTVASTVFGRSVSKQIWFTATELSGTSMAKVTAVLLSAQAYATNMDLGTLAAHSNVDQAFIGFVRSTGSNGSVGITLASGWTSDIGSYMLSSLDHPYAKIGHASPTGVALDPQGTATGGTGDAPNSWGGVAVRFYPTAAAITPGVFLDFDGDGFDIGDYDNVTDDAMTWSIFRGAGSEIIGGSTPGGCTLTLKNPDDIYNPYNPDGPLYGKLVDGIPIWIGVTDDGKVSGSTANGLFGGRVADIIVIPSPGAPEPATVELVCEDALAWYQRLPVRIDYAEGRSHAALRQAVLDAGGETRYDLAHEIQTMPLSHAEGSLQGTLDSINAVTGTRHFVKPADLYTNWYDYVTRNRQYGLTGTATAALDAGSDHVTGSDGWRLSADTVTNEQKATVTPILFTPATFTVWEADTLPIEVTVARPYTVIVSFDDVVSDSILNISYSGATVVSVYTPFATGGKIELSVASGTGTVAHLSIEGRLARRQEQVTYTSDDLTSQGVNARGIRAGGEIGNEYLGVLAEARGIADHVTWRYGNPQLRPPLVVENWFPEMFQLDLYDTIADTSTHLSMDARIFEIVGLRLDGNIAADTVQHHVVTYQLQECRVQSDPHWFTLNTSELAAAGTDVLGY
jgi:hypothetical protein